MLKKSICLIVISYFILFFLTGCYDATGIEDFYYNMALGIDKSSKSSIKLSVQISKVSSSPSSSSKQSSNYKIYTVDCTSIDSGINILNNYLNKRINLSHCSAIVFSEEIAQDGLKEYVNILANNSQIRPTCNIIISSKSAYDVLDKVANSGEPFSSRLYDYILTSVDYTGYTVDSTFSNFFSKINSSETQATTVYCSVIDDHIQNSRCCSFQK